MELEQEPSSIRDGQVSHSSLTELCTGCLVLSPLVWMLSLNFFPTFGGGRSECCCSFRRRLETIRRNGGAGRRRWQLQWPRDPVSAARRRSISATNQFSFSWLITPKPQIFFHGFDSGEFVAAVGRFRNVNKAGVSFPNSTNHAWILENKLQSETDRNRPPIQLTVMSHQPRFSMFLVMSTSGFRRHEELCRFHLNRSMSDGQHRDSQITSARYCS